MYYPMRFIRKGRYKLIVNLAHRLDYPFASDLWDSPTWQGVLKRGDKMMGERSVQDYLFRPKEELYDLAMDPKELKNLAGSEKHAEVLANLRRELRQWQRQTNDPWAILYREEKVKK
jgi:N-sulfoglucosamine sulfohydrolase